MNEAGPHRYGEARTIPTPKICKYSRLKKRKRKHQAPSRSFDSFTNQRVITTATFRVAGLDWCSKALKNELIIPQSPPALPPTLDVRSRIAHVLFLV